MKITVRDVPPIPKEVTNPETLAYFIATSLGLIPERGKGDVVIEMILLFRRISQVRDGIISEGGKTFPIKNGSMKAKDIMEYLRVKGHQISQSQFYVTYLSRFIESGLIVKRKGSMYGLRDPTLAITLEEIMRDIHRVWDKITDHARRLDGVIEG